MKDQVWIVQISRFGWKAEINDLARVSRLKFWAWGPYARARVLRKARRCRERQRVAEERAAATTEWIDLDR